MRPNYSSVTVLARQFSESLLSTADHEARWKQRFDNFQSAFTSLKAAVDLAQQRPLSDLEKQGLIQSFEFTHELAWNVLKDFLTVQGAGPLFGSKDTTREAFQKGLIADGDAWMDMIQSRSKTSHTYNKRTSEEIVVKIREKHFSAFVVFAAKMNELAKE